MEGFTLEVFILTSSLLVFSAQALNQRPVIGVIAQRTTDGAAGGDNLSLVSTTYVRWIQQAGALVVPVMINQPDSYYEDLFSQINGVVLPGGGGSIISSSYAAVSRIMFKLAQESNQKGDYFPIIGICYGFQMLSSLVTGKDLLKKCDASDYPLVINFTIQYNESRLFHDLPEDIAEALNKYPITYNDHKFCLTAETFNGSQKLTEFYREVSKNTDRKGLSFISTMEAVKFPFFGVQWHPETNIYYWNVNAHNNHSEAGVKLAQYTANFFVSEAKKSHHKFVDHTSEAMALIDNYSPTFLGYPTFESHYFFKI